MITDLLPDFGNPTMKSIEILVHTVDGMGKGCNVPGGFTFSPLCRWQV